MAETLACAPGLRAAVSRPNGRGSGCNGPAVPSFATGGGHQCAGEDLSDQHLLRHAAHPRGVTQVEHQGGAREPSLLGWPEAMRLGCDGVVNGAVIGYDGGANYPCELRRWVTTEMLITTEVLINGDGLRRRC